MRHRSSPILITLGLVILAALAGGCTISRLWEPSREEVLQRILPSGVQIVIEQKEGRRVRSSSGVAIAAQPAGDHTACYIVTAGHTVSGLVGETQAYVVFDAHRGEPVKTPASVIAYRDNADIDLALLRVEASPCTAAPPGPPPLLGASVWVVGFPWGRHMTLSRGIVSQISVDDGTDRETAARLMVDAAVSYGSSGGGVFEARDGALIGIVEGYSTARVSPQGANPSWYIDVPVPGQTFVTPLADVERFLSRTSHAGLVAAPVSGRARPFQP